MKRPEIPRSCSFWAALRWTGIVLSGGPVLLMLVSGIIGSVSSGQPRMDVLLPAELSLFTFPGLLLMALAAAKQRVYARLSAGLAAAAALAALVLCLVPSLTTRAMGLLWAALILFDLAAVAAPVVGLLSIRRLRRRTSEKREGPP